MSTIDLESDSTKTGSSSLQLDQILGEPDPTRIILVRNGMFTGPNMMGGGYASLKDCAQYQDSNPANVTGNTHGYLSTFRHNFVTMGTRFLFDVTDGQVYDLSARDANSLIVVWPSGTSQ